VGDDQHAFWRILRRNYDELERSAPEGYRPVVDVHIDGAPAPIPIGVVQTSSRHAWVMLQSLTEGLDDPGLRASDRFVFVHAGRINRVELRFARDDGKQLGFTVSVGDDDGD
jgi:hypothetical protein